MIIATSAKIMPTTSPMTSWSRAAYYTANRMQAMRLRLCASRMARVVFI